MELTEQQATNFQALYKTRFGQDISSEEAAQQAANLLELVELVYKRITKDEHERVRRS